MTELTFEEFCDLPLTYMGGMTGDWGAHRTYRNEDAKLQTEVVTKRKRHGDIYGGWKDGEVYYFLDGDSNTYRTLDQVYLAYMERVCGGGSMTQNDIIRMAREAGMSGLQSGGILENFEHFAALVAAVEREACAQVCLEEAPSLDGQLCAEAIRARGNNEH